MKKIIKLYFLLFLSISFSQSKNESLDELNRIINYSPTSFKPNNEAKPKNRFLQDEVKTIGYLESLYRFQESFNFNELEIKWMESEINELAKAFFIEKKPILFRKVGGYEGCENVKNVEVENINGYEVTILNYCYTCSGPTPHENKFMEIFNKRTEMLIRK